MDLRKQMIIIDGKIETNRISFCKCIQKTDTYMVQYSSSNKIYNFSKFRLRYLTDGNSIDLNKYSVYLNCILLKNVEEIIEFIDTINSHSYYHILFQDGTYRDCYENEIQKLSIDHNCILKYIKGISEIVSLTTEDGTKLLKEQCNKIQIEDLDDVLANYFKISDKINRKDNLNFLIFPFGCNSSQYKAVENAIYYKMSVIEGPPGTGKTQTILNILANLIIRGMNCQIVSNNNTAIENINEKLKKYDLDFIVALLGKRENKDFFVENQKDDIPAFEEYQSKSLEHIKQELNRCNEIVKEVYKSRKEIAILKQNERDFLLEYQHFQNYIESQKIITQNIRIKKQKFLDLVWREITCMEKIPIWKKIQYIFLYQIGNFSFYKLDMDIISNTIQNELYRLKLEELKSRILEKEQFIQLNSNYEIEYKNLSIDYFKNHLSLKYKSKRRKYSLQDIKGNYQQFLCDYPIILSTTHSARNTFYNDFRFDYIIMDESSQIDIVTGTLALSSAKNAVIIGDENQLPNVIKDSIKIKANEIFAQYSLDMGYSYSYNSFLSSVKQIISNAPRVLLQEHYRCHPKIINFCNKKFYNNQLIIMTTDCGEKDVIVVRKTAKGSHSRDKTSQRQVDVIAELLPRIKSDDIGIITPYRNQVSLIHKFFPSIEVNTIHKFQGREKDVIIISTVDDEITDFVSNANIFNVAISRAKKQIFFIVTGNDIKNKNINDFIDYVAYNNFEVSNSKIYSVFDLMYKPNQLEKLKFYKTHHKISRYDSENFIYYLIEKVMNDYDNLGFIFHQSMSSLINDTSLLSEKESKYARHFATHIDFLIYNTLSKKPVLAIEVDGYKYHKEGTEQYQRDLLKNNILKKYNIPLIRFKTNGSNEETILRQTLNDIFEK